MSVELPKNWKVVELGTIAKISSGGTPNRKKSEYWDGNIPWVKTGEINFNIITDTQEKITEEGLKNSAARIVPNKTLLMAMYGQGMTRGRVAVLNIDATVNQACAAILPNEDISTFFLFYSLMHKYEYIRNLGHGANQRNLNATIVKSIPVVLPPLPEQHAISQVLQTLQKTAKIRRQEMALEKERKAALMQHLFTHGTRGEARKMTEIGEVPESWEIKHLKI
jgi:type I restriction enzyme S subunit